MYEGITKCTRCGNELTDLRVGFELNIGVDRLKETGFWEEIPNLYQVSREVLCPDCFKYWTEIQSKMNIPYSKSNNISRGVGSEGNNSCKCNSDKKEESNEFVYDTQENLE